MALLHIKRTVKRGGIVNTCEDGMSCREYARLLDVHFSEDRTKVLDMNVQQTLNILRKIALNLAREYKNKYEPRKAISGIIKETSSSFV